MRKTIYPPEFSSEWYRAGDALTMWSTSILAIWSIAVVAVWSVAWLIYAAAAEFTACGIGTAHGDVHNEYWAGPVGLPLLLIAGGLAWRWRRRLRRLLPLFAAFVTLYIGGLLTLWATSPWGARCT